MPKRAVLRTLGCRLNQAETFLLRDKLAAAGYTVEENAPSVSPAAAPAPAAPVALVIINTCAVTRLAAAKCRQVIRQCIADFPDAFIVAAGCYSQLAAAELAAIGGIDLILGNQDKLNVLDHIGDGSKQPQPLVIRERVSRDDFSISFVGDKPFNKRANLKIQDGCDCGCTFCVIPKARGQARSRDFANLLAEAHALATRGVRELVLTGVNIGAYDSGGRDIAAVVDALNAVVGIDRLRIGSIEPTTVPDALLERMADPAHALLPHLHLPLQSGCERILHDMRRHYTKTEYATFARAALAKVPDLALGTDIIVGFPGETAAEFDETCAFLRELPFAYAHIFTYSERDGAPAARRPDAVPVPVRQQRSTHLRRLAAAKHREFIQTYLGQEMRVLFEDKSDDHWPALTDNYIRVVVSEEQAAGRDLTNQTAKVRLTKITTDFAEATLL
jgi:threonylcarbamoyladenosine tRNA methylthiotransferase MtaB